MERQGFLAALSAGVAALVAGRFPLHAPAPRPSKPPFGLHLNGNRTRDVRAYAIREWSEIHWAECYRDPRYPDYTVIVGRKYDPREGAGLRVVKTYWPDNWEWA